MIRSILVTISFLVLCGPNPAGAQFKEIPGVGLKYSDVIKLAPEGKRSVFIISTSSCTNCKSLRKAVTERAGNRKDISLNYVLMDMRTDGRLYENYQEWKENTDGGVPRGWREEGAIMNGYPFNILVDAAGRVVSRFDDAQDVIHAFKQTALYKTKYKSSTDPWPGDWTHYFKPTCGEHVGRIMAFIESGKICVEYPEVAGEFYNP